MPGTNMEIRQKKEQTGYQLRMTEAVRQDSKVYNLPPLSVVHDTPIAARDLHDSINYLGILLKRANRIHSSMSSLPPQEMERTKPTYYKALSDVRDFSIHCLELSGELYERGLLNVNDPDVVRIARFFCDIQDSTPDITSAGKAMLRSVSIIDANDPFETNRFRSEVVGYICSLATIPSGQVLLKTLFDLRYYNPKLDQTRRDHDQYLPSTMSVINPFIDSDPNISPSSYTTDTGSNGRITKEAQPRVMPGDFRQDTSVIPPFLEYNKLMQSMLDLIPSTERSDIRLLQHFAEVDMGHEMIHNIHYSYGVALTMSSTSIDMEERVTAGDVLDPMYSHLAGQTNKADSAIFEHAHESVKEAFIVSEQSLRRDFGAFQRHSYNQKLDIDGTGDELTEDERLVYLFSDKLIQVVLDNSFLNYGALGDEFEKLITDIEAHIGNGKMINQLISNYLSNLKQNRIKLVDKFFEKVFDRMIIGQYGESPTSQQEAQGDLFFAKLEKLLKLDIDNTTIFDMIYKLLTLRIKRELLQLTIKYHSATPATASASSEASPAATSAAAAAAASGSGSGSDSDD